MVDLEEGDAVSVEGDGEMDVADEVAVDGRVVADGGIVTDLVSARELSFFPGLFSICYTECILTMYIVLPFTYTVNSFSPLRTLYQN